MRLCIYFLNVFNQFSLPFGEISASINKKKKKIKSPPDTYIYIYSKQQ